MNVFLGCDGGGTKTALALVTAAGEVRASLLAPSCYYLSSASADVGLVRDVLSEAVSTLCSQAGTTRSEIRYAFLGLPGYGEVRADVPAVDAAVKDALGHERFRCDNDMVCGWAGSLAARDGINVISGTGSMAYGRRGSAGVRVGGWGELFGDEGSGYWIAVRGLEAFTRMSDGRTPAGPLADCLRERLSLEEDQDLIDLVLRRWRGGRREVAALSRIVADAAQRGDAAAAAIMSDAADELVRLVETTRGRLGFADGEQVAVSYSGGVFTARLVLDAVVERLTAASTDYWVTPPRYPPVLGAALYAAVLAGSPFDDAALCRLRAEDDRLHAELDGTSAASQAERTSQS